MLNRKFILFCLVGALVACLSSGFRPSDSFTRSVPATPLTSWNMPKVPSAAVMTQMAQNISPSRIQPEPATPTVRIHYNYYPISGSTATALRSQMSRLGPLSKVEGRSYDANTDWYVQWSYHRTMTRTGCAIASVTGSVDITFTLPQWNSPTGTSRSLLSEWNRYLVALQAHEDGHKENGIAASRGVMNALNRLPTYASCQQLETAANWAIDRVIQQAHQQDINYDRVTHHGRTQGAVFPTDPLLS